MHRYLVALGVLVMGLAQGLAPAYAQDAQARARSEFARGVSFYSAGDHQAALAAFQEAYRLSPHPVVRLNMANCYEQLERPVEAIFHYERFLAETTNVRPARQREIRTALRRLRTSVGQVEFHVTPDGSQVLIDGREMRRAPVLEPLQLSAGMHDVEISHDGYETQREEFEVRGGGRITVSLRLNRSERVVAPQPQVEVQAPAREIQTVEPEVDAQPQEPAPERNLANALAAPQEAAEEEPDTTPLPNPEQAVVYDEGATFTTGTWVAGGVTLALLGGALTSGFLAMQSNDLFESAVTRSTDEDLSLDVRRQAVAEGHAAAEDTNVRTLVADIFFVGALASAITTVVLAVVGDPEEGADELSQIRLTPLVGQNMGGASLAGSF